MGEHSLDAVDALPAWHEMFDKLALERGHRDNLALAQALCEHNGNSSQPAFDTAVKNLRNWRAGHHLPQRRNFLLLTQLIDIDELEPDRIKAWHAAYLRAQRSRESAPAAPAPLEPRQNSTRVFAAFTTGTDAPGGQPVSQVQHTESQSRTAENHPRSRSGVFSSGLLLGVVAGAALGLVLGSVLVPQSIRLAFDIPPDFASASGEPATTMVLRPGQSMVIGSVSARGCETSAPAWDEVAAVLPELDTGVLSDGGPGNYYDPSCGTRVGARGILFSAQDRGEEQFLLTGDSTRIKVY